MHRLITPVSALTLVLFGALGCGGKKPANDATAKTDTTAEGKEGSSETSEGGGEKGEGDKNGAGGEKAEKKDDCLGFDIANLEDALLKSACEVPNAKPDTLPNAEVKGKLEVTVTASPTRVGPGGKVDLLVTFANKTKEPMTLHFRIDPTARFESEAYDKKNKRVDMPAGNPPPPPKGHSQPPPNEPKVARVTITANGSARARIPWEAVKMKWAPDKVRGTPSEKGYPRTPAGPLPKGKYTVKVQTPLVGVMEGVDHEISGPKTEIEVGG